MFFKKNGGGRREGRVTNSWFVVFIAGLEVHNVTNDWMTAYVLRHGRSGAW